MKKSQLLALGWMTFGATITVRAIHAVAGSWRHPHTHVLGPAVTSAILGALAFAYGARRQRASAVGDLDTGD